MFLRRKHVREAAKVLAIVLTTALCLYVIDTGRSQAEDKPCDMSPIAGLSILRPEKATIVDMDNDEKMNEVTTTTRQSVWETIQARQAVRHKRKQELCVANGPWPDLNPKAIDTMMVDSLHKAAFCAVAKTASTSWTTTLLAVTGNSQIPPTQHMPFIQSNKSALTYIKNYSPEQGKQILKDYFTFAFVREPWERLLSCWYSTVHKRKHFYHKEGAKDVLLQFSESQLEEKVAFPEFLDHLATSKNGLAKANKHWRPIYLWCHLCQVNYTFIGTLENMDEESNYVLYHGLKQPAEDVLMKKNSNRRGKTASLLRDAYVDVRNDTLKRIQELFRLDFELFGYPIKPPI